MSEYLVKHMTMKKSIQAQIFIGVFINIIKLQEKIS